MKAMKSYLRVSFITCNLYSHSIRKMKRLIRKLKTRVYEQKCLSYINFRLQSILLLCFILFLQNWENCDYQTWLIVITKPVIKVLRSYLANSGFFSIKWEWLKQLYSEASTKVSLLGINLQWINGCPQSNLV